MKVKVGNLEFNIIFIKEKDQHNDGSEKINTICRIFMEGMYQSEGIARLNYRDKHNKTTGKKIALKRALESMPYFARSGSHECDKARRTVVWDAFSKYFRNK